MESPCWIWTAGLCSNGYGNFWWDGKTIAAHRVAWMLANGPIPNNGSYHGFCICHRCDNPACANSSHFFLGTHADNVKDMNNKGRGNRPRGDNHHYRIHPEWIPHGEAAGNSKLTYTKANDIRVRYKAGGISQTRLALEFNVSQATISSVINKSIWHTP